MPASHHGFAPGLSALLALGALAPAHGQDAMVRVSVDGAGNEANGASLFADISGDGLQVAFESDATNLVAGDNNGATDVFVRDLATGAVARVSVDSAGNEGDGRSFAPKISGDGRFVVFQSNADDLVAGDTNGGCDVFVHDRDPDQNGAFDEGNGVTLRASVDSAGVGGDNTDDGSNGTVSISADGMRVAFFSLATNLVAGDVNGLGDVFVHDFANGTTTRVSVDSAGAESDGTSYRPSISNDGKFVAFLSDATNLVPGDSNGHLDVFRHNLANGGTIRVNLDSSGVEADGDSLRAWISGDGSFVAFDSNATNLDPNDTNHRFDTFLRDVKNDVTTRVSVDSAGAEGNNNSLAFGISADGQTVLIESSASNLAPNDTNGSYDVFVHEMGSAATILVTQTCLGFSGNGSSYSAAISDDATRLVFNESSTDLVTPDTNGAFDIYLFDRAIGWPQGTWTNYGSGFAGSLGVPAFTASADPAFGASITVDLANSQAGSTAAIIAFGLARASIPTTKGGTLLVSPFLWIPITLPSGGTSFPLSVPFDPTYCGVTVDLQALELDAGAAKGISFTAGLELVFGQ